MPSDANNTGYVCLDDETYLVCYGEYVHYKEKCQSTLKCTSAVGKWSEDVVCNFDYSSTSSTTTSSSKTTSSSSSKTTTSSSGSDDAKTLCEKYTPSDANNTGYVCLDDETYLTCYGEYIHYKEKCQSPLKCTSTIGKWSQDFVCNFVYSGSLVDSESKSEETPSTSSSTSSDDLQALCKKYSGNSANAGFVCLHNGDAEYLRCFTPHNVATMMPCPPGLRCTAEPNTWTENPPCGTGTTERDPDSPEALCLKYVKSIYDFGYVCLEANATQYLRCYPYHGVSVMMDCAPGTACTATPNVLTTATPCHVVSTNEDVDKRDNAH